MAEPDVKFALPKTSVNCEKPNDSKHSTNQEQVESKYVLYRYNTNRPSDDEKKKEETKDTPSPDGNFSLSMSLAALKADEETTIREFVAKKLAKGSLHGANGHISNITLTSSSGEEKSSLCYYCILRRHDLPADSSSPPSPSYFSNQFVLCLLASSDSLLDLFRPELDRYSAGLLSLLDGDIPDLNTTVKPYLEGWYNSVTGHLSYCVRRFQADIKYLVYAALGDAKLDLQCTDNEIIGHIRKFVSCCSLSEVLTTEKPTGSSSSLSDGGGVLVDLSDENADTNPETTASGNGSVLFPERENIVLRISDTDYEFISKDCTPFCEMWADALLAGDEINPVYLRQVIDNYKLKSIHDMNTLKRLLRLAETSHYALYRCYMFLCSCDNGPVLLRHAWYDELNVSGSPGAEAVLLALDQHIKDCGGFTLPRCKTSKTQR